MVQNRLASHKHRTQLVLKGYRKKVLNELPAASKKEDPQGLFQFSNLSCLIMDAILRTA